MHLRRLREQYTFTAAQLGNPENVSKDIEGTVVPVFGIEVDTNQFMARLPEDKVLRACTLCSDTLSRSSVTLHSIQSLAGLLNFCAQVVQLRWVYMRYIWDFIASFLLNSPFLYKETLV